MPTPTSFQPPTQTLEHVLGSDPAVVRGFARAVADQLVSGPLRLIDRDRLIKRGVRLGLKRFDANLVVAAMEQKSFSRPSLRISDYSNDEPETRLPIRLGVAAAIAVQACICLGAWWAFFA